MKVALSVLLLLSSSSNHVALAASFWVGPFSMPSIAAVAYNLPNGKVLTFSAYARYVYNGIGGQTYTAKFDPTTGNSTEALITNTHHDMFCPGTAQLGDGRIMITGGADSSATTFYDPATDTWSIGPPMVIARGYHAMTVLDDGSVFTIGGSWSGGFGNKFGEVWNATTGVWTIKPNLRPDPLLTNDNGGIYRQDNQMWFVQAPNGKIFHAGPSKQMNWIDVTGNGTITPSVLRGDDLDVMNGNAVLYDIGKILKVGGSTSYENTPAMKSAYIIDINGVEAVVERVSDMAFNRSFSNSVVLPSGEVVVIGGMAFPVPYSDAVSVFAAELWNPTTKQFIVLASMTVPRNYHSVGVLLEDGRVLAAGGGLCGDGCPGNHADGEILTPPYLLNADRTPAVKPVIISAPDVIIPGSTISVTMDTSASHSFALVRLSVTTHSVNNDQRRIPLQVVQASNGVFTILIPENPSVVLPGPYFLFAMNSNGVPGIAHTVSRPNNYPRPSQAPSKQPTSSPSKSPTTGPTSQPTTKPTSIPTITPTKGPTLPPITLPTNKPTGSPTQSPTKGPTGLPSKPPTSTPTKFPTTGPTLPSSLLPTNKPTSLPTGVPTTGPTPPLTAPPTNQPTLPPTNTPPPTAPPTNKSTLQPTNVPTNGPTLPPTTFPTNKPTSLPTKLPTNGPTPPPTAPPTNKSTLQPTNVPTNGPTLPPTTFPTNKPTSLPTKLPTNGPTSPPTTPPTNKPTTQPTNVPTNGPTLPPTTFPTNKPTSLPTKLPTNGPTPPPTTPPTNKPMTQPTNVPTNGPILPSTAFPTNKSTSSPTKLPTNRPTPPPTAPPTNKPTLQPTNVPMNGPTPPPTGLPTSKPTSSPTKLPTITPTSRPTSPPTNRPTLLPTVFTPTTPKPTLAPGSFAGTIVNITLITSSTNRTLVALYNGTVVRLSTLGTISNEQTNFRADTVGAVQIVRFEFLNLYRIVDTQPFILPSLWLPVVGAYSLRTTPFMVSNGRTTAGQSIVINFSVAK